jgi:hypothetical protein
MNQPLDDQAKKRFFLQRTSRHVERVKQAARMIVQAYPQFIGLLKNVETHDRSKFEAPEHAPYVNITWRHKQEKDRGQFDSLKGNGYQDPGHLEDPDENGATVHHITTNPHHPEFWSRDRVLLNKSDRSKLNQPVDVRDMPDLYVAEMVADWQAMAWELGNDAREWFNKQNGNRWEFSDHQVELIDKLLKVFEE